MYSQDSNRSFGEVAPSVMNPASMSSVVAEDVVLGVSLADQFRHQDPVEDTDEVLPADHHVQTTVESSEEPHVEERLKEAINTPLPSPATGETQTVPPDRPQSALSTVSTEPFPEFELSEDRLPYIFYEAQEQIYINALSKVAQEIERVKEAEDILIAIRGPLFSVEDYNTHVSNGPSITILDGVRPCPEVSHYNHYCVQHETHKVRLQARIRDFLFLNKDLPETFRKRFVRICDLVVEMEYFLFRRKRFPKDPIRLITQNDLLEVRCRAVEIVQYLSAFGIHIFNEKNKTQCTHYSVARMASAVSIPLHIRFKEMLQIVEHYLKQVCSTGDSFLDLFFHFYDVVLYDDFHVMYNNYLVKTCIRDVPDQLLQTSSLLTTIFEMLTQMIPDYRVLRDITVDIGQHFLRPVINELAQGRLALSEPIHNATLVSELEGDYPSAETKSNPSLSLSQLEPEIHISRDSITQGLPSEGPSEAHRVDFAELPGSHPDTHGTENHSIRSASPLSFHQPVEDYYLPGHYTEHSQVLISYSPDTISEQGSNSGDDTTEDSQGALSEDSDSEGYESEYVPTEIISSFEFRDYYARVNQANRSHSYSAARTEAAVFSAHGLQGFHDLSAQDEEAQDSEQDLDQEFEFLDPNATDDEWLPHDHDPDHPEGYHTFDNNSSTPMDSDYVSIDTFSARIEQMAQACIYENGEFNDPTIPADFQFHGEAVIPGESRFPFAARRPSSSSSVARAEFPQYEAVLRGSRPDARPPSPPPFSEYGSVITDEEEEEEPLALYSEYYEVLAQVVALRARRRMNR